jgi:hypothetical protein
MVDGSEKEHRPPLWRGNAVEEGEHLGRGGDSFTDRAVGGGRPADLVGESSETGAEGIAALVHAGTVIGGMWIGQWHGKIRRWI